MQRLPIINLTNEDMEALFKTEPFAIGGESIIYKTTRDTLYKIFTDEEEALLQYPFENKISNESPIGSAIIGRKVGDIVDVDANGSSYQVKILKIA